MARAPRILIAHNSFPAQYQGLAPYLARRGWEVMFMTQDETVPRNRITERRPRLRTVGLDAPEDPPEAHPWLRSTAKAVATGELYLELALRMRNSGYVPDLIVAHSGWGSGAYLRCAWPTAPQVQYLEWWYRHPARDVADAAEMPHPEKRAGLMMTRNLPFFLDAQAADAILAPTAFQAAEVPEILRGKLRIEHDGVDTAFFSPGAPAALSRAEIGVPEGAPLVTFATRGMEPARGFPQFMAALSRLQAARPDLHCAIAGNDRVSYGAKLEGDTWKARMLREHSFDESRLHFTGKLPFDKYRDLLRLSDVHVALTQPFVLSWSFVQSMATGCAMVVSDNGAVREAMPRDGLGEIVDHHDIDALTAAIARLLDDPARRAALSAAARDEVLARYDAAKIHPAKEAWFRELIEAGPGIAFPGA